MEKGAIYSAIKHRKVTIFIVILVMILGMYNYFMLPRQEYPDINPPFAVITAVYPGAQPSDVEKLVTSKIEDEVAEIKGYDYCYSTSKNGLSVVILRLDKNADIDKAWTDLRQKMDDLKPRLPDGCGEININTNVTETAGMLISMSGDGYSYEELAAYAEKLKKELIRVDGITRFDVVGKQEKEVKVTVDAARMSYYNLSLGDITNIIKSQNVEIPSGQLNDGKVRINVKTPGTYSSLEDIGNTVVSVSESNGSVARLKDIADISMGLEDSNFKIKQNGKNAVLLAGYFKDNKNIVRIGGEVEKKLEEFKRELPEDITYDEVLFQPRDIQNSIDSFIMNLLEGVFFVVAVVFIGMGLRNAAIVSTAIPLSIIITFSFMRLLGIKLHQISIAALIIALGMLVDNAIVVSDAIQVRIDSGEEKMSACVNGVREVAIPVLTSTLTTIGAFIPLLMLPSVSGEYVRSIPQIIIISLSASYLVALFVTPTMAYILFKKGAREFAGFSRLRKLLNIFLGMGMKHKKATVLLAVTAFAVTLLLATTLGLQFFPKADKNIVYVDVKTEQSADISKTESLADRVASILKEQKEVISFTEAIGDGLPKFYNAMPLYTQSSDFAQFMVRLDLKKGGRFKKNTQFVNYLQQILDSRIVGGTATVKELEQGDPVGAPITIRVNGEDMQRLKEVSDMIQRKLSKIDGTVNIDDDLSDRVYEFSVDIDGDKASMFGISRYDVQNEINIALMGKKASIFRKDGNEYDILVESNIKNKEQLENLPIKSSLTGNMVLLKEIAQVKLINEQPSIKKYDRNICITVTSDLKFGYNPVKIEEQLRRELEGEDLRGVDIVYSGEKHKINVYFGDMGNSAVFAVLVVFGILLLQFGNFTQPLIILLTIPLSVIGSVFGLMIFRQPLSFTGLLGIVSLLGIVVNNAIILIDYINDERRRAMSIEAACITAVDKRFRPIMLTTTTTVIGLIPLIMSGSELFRPMSISLMCGLMVATILTMVVIPVVYSLVEIAAEKGKSSATI